VGGDCAANVGKHIDDDNGPTSVDSAVRLMYRDFYMVWRSRH